MSNGNDLGTKAFEFLRTNKMKSEAWRNFCYLIPLKFSS